MDTNIQQTPAYHSLEELQLRKEQLLGDIRNDSNNMTKMWRSLFSDRSSNSKKGLNMATVINTGAGLFDGFMLAWKLYKKFRR